MVAMHGGRHDRRDRGAGGRLTLEALVDAGHIRVDGDVLVVTPAGYAAIPEGLREHLRDKWERNPEWRPEGVPWL
jgi:hypothetical protein